MKLISRAGQRQQEPGLLVLFILHSRLRQVKQRQQTKMPGRTRQEIQMSELERAISTP